MNNIKLISYSDREFELVRAIRKTVFIEEQGAIADEEFDEYDRNATFALLYDSASAVGTARYVMTDTGCKIGRIALLRECRGRGYGADIVRFVVQKVFEQGESFVLVDAQNYAVPFYEKLGFKVTGNEIIDRGLPHIPMKLEKEFYYGKDE